MLLQIIQNLMSDIAVLQRYIIVSQDAGFNDTKRLLETLSIQLFKASHELALHNKNLFNPTFPAIDLADDANKTAVQVTSNADPKKINHTLKMFDKHKLGDSYDKLYIHGFVNCSKPRSLPSHCTIFSISQLVGKVTDKNDEDLAQGVADALQQHTDFSRIHPYDDRNCLEIVLRCIDRNAVKHRMESEGSYKKMVTGLNEITELISKGTINRKRKSKDLDAFQNTSMKEFMASARDIIGRIIAIVNQSRTGNGDVVNIPPRQREQIDEFKAEIVRLSNAIANKHGIDLNLDMF
jgi:hypothetical protein